MATDAACAEHLWQQMRDILTHPDNESLRQRADSNLILRDVLKMYSDALSARA